MLLWNSLWYDLVFSPGWHESKVDSVGTRQSDGANWGTHCPNTNCLETCRVKEWLSVLLITQNLLIYVPYCLLVWSYFYGVFIIPCNLISKHTHTHTHNLYQSSTRLPCWQASSTRLPMLFLILVSYIALKCFLILSRSLSPLLVLCLINIPSYSSFNSGSLESNWQSF